MDRDDMAAFVEIYGALNETKLRTLIAAAGEVLAARKGNREPDPDRALVAGGFITQPVAQPVAQSVAAKYGVQLPASRRSSRSMTASVMSTPSLDNLDSQVTALLASGDFRAAEAILPWADLASGPTTTERVTKIFGSVKAYLAALEARVHSGETDAQRAERQSLGLFKRVHMGATPADVRRQRAEARAKEEADQAAREAEKDKTRRPRIRPKEGDKSTRPDLTAAAPRLVIFDQDPFLHIRAR